MICKGTDPGCDQQRSKFSNLLDGYDFLVEPDRWNDVGNLALGEAKLAKSV